MIHKNQWARNYPLVNMFRLWFVVLKTGKVNLLILGDSIDLSLTSMNALLLTSSIYYKELSKLFTVNRYLKTVGNNKFADRLRSKGDI